MCERFASSLNHLIDNLQNKICVAKGNKSHLVLTSLAAARMALLTVQSSQNNPLPHHLLRRQTVMLIEVGVPTETKQSGSTYCICNPETVSDASVVHC